MESKNWAIGDSLLVKSDVTDPAAGIPLGGWQGRLIARSEKDDRLTIQWDSLTLLNLPLAYLIMCEQWGVSWATMRLASQHVELTAARDREEDVTAAIAMLETQSSWSSLGEQGRRIQQVVNRASEHDRFTALRTWHAYLEEHLMVPFLAKVVEAQRGPVPQGVQVKVTGINILDDSAGTIVRTRLIRTELKRRVYYFPLCDLRAINVPIEIQQLVDDYAKWFIHHDYIYARRPR